MLRWLRKLFSSVEAPTDLVEPPVSERQNGAPPSASTSSRPSHAPDQTWSDDQWLAALRERDEDAIRSLQKRLADGLLAALKRASFQRRVPRRTEALAEEAAQEAVERISERLDDYQESLKNRERRFTTWAQKIAVHVAFSKLRRGH